MENYGLLGKAALGKSIVRNLWSGRDWDERSAGAVVPHRPPYLARRRTPRNGRYSLSRSSNFGLTSLAITPCGAEVAIHRLGGGGLYRPSAARLRYQLRGKQKGSALELSAERLQDR